MVGIRILAKSQIVCKGTSRLRGTQTYFELKQREVFDALVTKLNLSGKVDSYEGESEI